MKVILAAFLFNASCVVAVFNDTTPPLSAEGPSQDFEEELEAVTDISTGEPDKHTPVRLELVQNFDDEEQPTLVTSFNLTATLLLDGEEKAGAQQPRAGDSSVTCSYVVRKSMPPSKVYTGDANEVGKWVEDTTAERAPDEGRFVTSQTLGYAPLKTPMGTVREKAVAAHIRQELSTTSRMFCTGKIEVKTTSTNSTRSSVSIFHAPPHTGAHDITSLELVLLNNAETAQARIVYDRHAKAFYMIGDNDILFKKHVETSAGDVKARAGDVEAADEEQTKRRNLELYRFKCREHEKIFTINIGIVVDSAYCKTMAPSGELKDCEDAAKSTVLLASTIFESQMKVRVNMATFLHKPWTCDRSKSFSWAFQRMRIEAPLFPQKRAGYHYFTTCLPSCYPGCKGVTLGRAYLNGIARALSPKKEKLAGGGSRLLAYNIGINRFSPLKSFTFAHELGHLFGAGHFFSIRDRDVDDKNPTTKYGIMDYTDDGLLQDPAYDGARNSKYNNVLQFTPRQEERKYKGSKTRNIPCEAINNAYAQWRKGNRLTSDELFSFGRPRNEQQQERATTRTRKPTTTTTRRRTTTTTTTRRRTTTTTTRTTTTTTTRRTTTTTRYKREAGCILKLRRRWYLRRERGGTVRLRRGQEKDYRVCKKGGE